MSPTAEMFRKIMTAYTLFYAQLWDESSGKWLWSSMPWLFAYHSSSMMAGSKIYIEKEPKVSQIWLYTWRVNKTHSWFVAELQQFKTQCKNNGVFISSANQSNNHCCLSSNNNFPSGKLTSSMHDWHEEYCYFVSPWRMKQSKRFLNYSS